jgi:hypothetical protein
MRVVTQYFGRKSKLKCLVVTQVVRMSSRSKLEGPLYLHTRFAALSSEKMSLYSVHKRLGGYVSCVVVLQCGTLSYLRIEHNMPATRILWFICICPNRNGWYAPTFAVILLSIVVTAEHHVHRSRGLRHSHRTEDGVAGHHALEADGFLAVRVQVEIVIYSPVMLQWPQVCARNACSWLRVPGSDSNIQSCYLTVTTGMREECV